MARGNRQDLFLNVRGDVTDLKTAMAAGKTVLNEFGGAAVNVLEEVEREIKKVGAGGLPDLKKTEAAFTASFKRIGENARAALNAPDGASAVQILDANAARQSAEAATVKAAALRQVAEAASRASAADKGASAATRAYAVAASTAAVEADDYARGLREQAVVLGSVEQQLGSVGRAQTRSVAISGQARSGYQQLSYQLGDVATQYAAGTSASIIFAQQSGQVIQALQLINTGGNKVLDVIGGPWGVAFGAALVVLTPFVGKLLEGNDALGDAIDKLKEDAAQTEATRQAKEAFATTEEGVAAAIRDATEARKQSIEGEQSAAERANIEAKQNREAAIAIRRKTLARLEDQKALLALQIDRASGPGQSSEIAALSLSRMQRQLAETEKLAARQLNDIAEAEAELQASRVDLAGEAAERAVDPLARINKLYDDQAAAAGKAAREAAKGGDEVTAALTRQLAAIERNRKAALQAEQERQSQQRSSSRGSSNNQFGRQVDVAGATRIVQSIGGRVTSGIRSTERQAQLYAAKQAGRHKGPVAAPGTSAHEAGGAYDAIDVAYGPGISVQSIRKAFAEEGVRLRKILNEPDQRVYHVEFAREGATGDREAARASRDAETAARKAEAAERKRVQDADAYASLFSQVSERRLDLERSRVSTIEQAANADVQSAELARADVERAAQKGVELGRWTQAQADAVKAIALENAITEQMAVRRREQMAIAQRTFEIEQGQLSDKAEIKRIEEDLAETAAERRTIARQLLKLDQDRRAKELDNAIAMEKDPAQRAALQGRRNGLPGLFSAQDEALEQDIADPLTRKIDSLKQSAKDVDEALAQASADGLQNLEDGLVGVISGTESVGDAFKRMSNQIIADLARIAVQKLIVNAIGGSFFGLADGGKVSSAPSPSFGSNLAIGDMLGYADGGMIRGPGTGRSDSILALVGGRKPIRVSNGEAIVNERGVREHWPLIDAINKGQLPKFADGGLVAPIGFSPRMPALPSSAALGGGFAQGMSRSHLTISLSDDLDARIDRRSADMSIEVVRQAAPALIDNAKNATVAELRRPSL